MHPLCLTIIRRPDLVVDHLSAYAALFKQEANDASNTLVDRVLVWLIALISVVTCLIFSGFALMLGVLQNQFHWILVAVPGAMALCALSAFVYTKQNAMVNHFSNIKAQFLCDSSALRSVASHEAEKDLI